MGLKNSKTDSASTAIHPKTILHEIDLNFQRMGGLPSDWLPRHQNRYLESLEVIQRRLVSEEPRRKGRALRLLDVGMGWGHLAVAASRFGAEVSGVDHWYGPAPRNVCREEGLSFHDVNIELFPLPFPDEHFDMVLFCEVIEHLNGDPAFPLTEIGRVLRPGGLLLLTTPNAGSLANRLKRAVGRPVLRPAQENGDKGAAIIECGRTFTYGHHRLYGMRALDALVTNAGFKVIRCCTLHSGSYPGFLGAIRTTVERFVGFISPETRNIILIEAEAPS
jgi:2-polyprenyl-3-methyl-5-hydroxy-6-metoxy-1,4-benzoquinol methylase